MREIPRLTFRGSSPGPQREEPSFLQGWALNGLNRDDCPSYLFSWLMAELALLNGIFGMVGWRW
jgi:hypothetical protein